MANVRRICSKCLKRLLVSENFDYLIVHMYVIVYRLEFTPQPEIGTWYELQYPHLSSKCRAKKKPLSFLPRDCRLKKQKKKKTFFSWFCSCCQSTSSISSTNPESLSLLREDQEGFKTYCGNPSPLHCSFLRVPTSLPRDPRQLTQYCRMQRRKPVAITPQIWCVALVRISPKHVAETI